LSTTLGITLALPLAGALSGITANEAAACSWACRNIGRPVAQGAQNAGRAVEQAARDTGRAVEQGARDTGRAVEQAARDTGRAVEQGARDTGRAVEQGARDTGVAVQTLGRYAARQVRSQGDAIAGAARRVREGKFVDAVWHLAIDPLRDTERNAALAMQESDVLRAGAQVAASVQGGPPGAAAFAAWYTYRQTGDAELALRVGLISGAASAGFSAVGGLPADSAAQVAQKAILSGAVGGLAVAASGGDERAVLEGFVLAGGMVVVQAAYQNVTTHPLDARPAEGAAYCMTSVGAECSPEARAYVRDSQGNIRYDQNGRPLVDVRATEPRRPHVGTWSSADSAPLVGAGERSASMQAVARVPGMNAMALFHDQWSVSWKMDPVSNVATIPPAVIFTYHGTQAPALQAIRETATERQD